MKNETYAETARVHHFYVAVAKYQFLHKKYGVVSVRDPIRLKDAEKYQLRPLLLYGLTVAGLPIKWLTFSPLNEPLNLFDVLLAGWNNADGLRGRPDVLLISKNMAKACPTITEILPDIGVKVRVADTKEKSLPGSLRSAQDSARWLSGIASLTKQNKPSHGIEALNAWAQKDHEFDRTIRYSRYCGKQLESILNWYSLPFKSISETPKRSLSWDAGTWLSSWQTSLPPFQPRYFDFDRMDGIYWLLTGEQPQEGFDVDNEQGIDDHYDVYDN